MVNAKKQMPKPIEPEFLQTPVSKQSDQQTESRATPQLGDAQRLSVIKLASSDSETAQSQQQQQMQR